MSLHGVPNDIISNLDPIALIIFIPVVDLLLYPALRKAGINFSPSTYSLGCNICLGYKLTIN